MTTNFSAILKELREKAGFESQTQFAKACGVDNSTIAKLERGESRSTPQTLAKMAPILHVTLIELMIAAGYVDKSTAINPITRDDGIIAEVNFPKLLKKLRETAGFESQIAFAKVVGVDNSTIARLESGETRPSLETLDKFALVLRVSQMELMIAAGYIDMDSSENKTSSVENLANGLRIPVDELLTVSSANLEEDNLLLARDIQSLSDFDKDLLKIMIKAMLKREK